jgi:alcohol dehydrogenase
VKAWRLTAPGGELSFRDVPEPAVTDGSVLVRMHASPLLSYLRSYVEGKLTTYLPPEGEFTPGTNGVGVVESAGSDVYGLAAGQRVFCSPLTPVRGR